MKRCIYPIILIFLTYGQISYQGKAVLNSDLTGKRIKLSLDNGYIHVQGWEKKSIEIYAYQESRLLDDKPLNFILIESAQTIQLHPEDQSGFYTYEIFAPYAINLDLTIHNTGFIRVNKIAGEIEANSSSGNIRLSETSGSAIVNSQTGTIFADFVSLNNKQHYAFSNAYGSVYLSIPDDSRVTFEISTVKGDAYSDFKLSVP
ncbi:MAG: hypothetical protein KDD94_12580, partial [Calditrichaeota bacterium]|nr:hypothetical protein [Calditrichota bacterium]